MNEWSGIDRRAVLRALAGASAGALAGCGALEPGDDAETREVEDDRSRKLAARFAPTVYFDVDERWFPTDPRPYASDRDGRTVVDGFDALEGYTRRATEVGGAPDPTVFYHVVEYRDSPLAVVQYWSYSAFDQFTTNFHWHDWEVFHAFVDTETGEPQLYVASAHSRSVPNNEFLDPDAERTPRILSELGSHSSTLSINDRLDEFQRLPGSDLIADITNRAIEGVEALAELPVAYGLPRDEGSRLPYLVPELAGEPIYDHRRLPSVGREDLIDEALTVRTYDDLTSPPTDLPGRETGTVFQHAERDGEADVDYELVPTAELEHVDAFTGPQLSFEFAVPQFAEDAVASHITTTGTPWTQPRYTNPAADVTDPAHRAALADRYDAVGAPAPVNSVVALVTRAVQSEDAPDGQGLATEASPVEAVALFESEPTAVPTFRGAAVVRDVPEGTHRLTVNRAGAAPHGEPVAVEGRESTAAADETITAGVDGEIPLVDRADAVKLAVDTEGTDRDLTSLAVEDDFAGRLYDAPLTGPDAVYVHRGGAYTTEVRDTDGAVGAFRVTPADERRVRIDEPRTGKATLATYLADVAAETRAQAAAVADDDGRGTPDGSESAVRGLTTALGAVAEAARRAAERASAGDRGEANRRLETVAARLEQVAERLTGARDGLPGGLANATDRRLEQMRRRTEQARAAEKL